MRRVVLPQLSLDPSLLTSHELSLEPDTAHYLLRVLRQSPGQEIEVCDGKGMRWLARIHEQAALHACMVTLLEQLPSQPEPFPIYLAQGLPKGDKLELILRQGTEVGISGFFPFSSDRTVVQLDAKKAVKRLERWEKIVQEAARQSQRGHAPEVHEVVALRELNEILPKGWPRLICWEGEQSLGLQAWVRSFSAPPPGVVILIGPEGGFSAQEVESLRQQGVISVGLGPLILRTETAGLAVSSILQYEWGLLSG